MPGRKRIMKHQLRNILPRMAVVLTIALTAFVWSAPAQAACLSSKQARQAVSKGQARSLGSLRVKGKILKAQLCQQRGGLVYVLSVLNKGNVSKMVVDARSGRRL